MDDHLAEQTETDPELDDLAESIDMVDAALDALDRDDVDEAEAVVAALPGSTSDTEEI